MMCENLRMIAWKLVVAIHTIFEKGVSRKKSFKVLNKIFSYEI